MQQEIKNGTGNNGIHNGHAYVDLGLPSGIIDVSYWHTRDKLCNWAVRVKNGLANI